MVKVLLSGCCGKMGTVITNLVSEFPNLEIVAGIDKFPKEELNILYSLHQMMLI